MKQPVDLDLINYPAYYRILWVVGKMYPHPPSGKGQHADPIQDVVLYLRYRILLLQKNPHPHHPHPWTKTEIYEMLSQTTTISDEREIDLAIPAFGENLIQVRIPADWFFSTTGLQPSAISASGVRQAIVRGEKIFKLAGKKEREWFDQIPISLLQEDFGPSQKTERAKRAKRRLDPLDFVTWLRICQLFPMDKAITWVRKGDKPTCFKSAK